MKTSPLSFISVTVYKIYAVSHLVNSIVENVKAKTSYQALTSGDHKCTTFYPVIVEIFKSGIKLRTLSH